MNIRPATEGDTAQWLELLKSGVGEEYPDKAVFDTVWASDQLNAGSKVETWVAEFEGQLQAAISILPPPPDNNNPIANLGRHLARPESYSDGSSEALLAKINALVAERRQFTVSRVLASNNSQQVLYEKLGYVCVGFQPAKHMTRVRDGALYYVRMDTSDLIPRMPISESLPQIQELATAVLSAMHFPAPTAVRDGAVGYPLQSELKFHDATFDDYELWRIQAQTANPPVEISGSFHLGVGFLRTAPTEPLRALLAQREDQVVAGLLFNVDSIDRCARFVGSFATDDLSMGALLHHAVRVAGEQFSSVYVEVDIVMTAPRLLKSAEQLGFVPIAYLPAFFLQEGRHADVVKMVKLNLIYSQEQAPFTSQARTMVEIIDHNFQDQKVGVAIINLLRSLPIFEGLGDGELRKFARLFTQKLFRGGEKIFKKGDSGNEAYVVMRGQIDIVFDEQSKPLASLGNGQIFGEQAFLDGAARGAMAVAVQPSILLVIQRSAFNDLVRHEPHLGMVVIRNIAIELSNRLRRTTAAASASKN